MTALNPNLNILDHAPENVPVCGTEVSRENLYWAGTLIETFGLVFQSTGVALNNHESTALMSTGLGIMGAGILVIGGLESYIFRNLNGVDWDAKKITTVAVRALGGVLIMAGFGTTIYGVASGDRTAQIAGICVTAGGMLIGQLGTGLMLKA